MIRAILNVAAGVCVMSTAAAAADAARYIKIEFTGDYATYSGYTFDGDNVREYQYRKAWSGEFLLDTAALWPGEDAWFADPRSSNGGTYVGYNERSVSLIYFEGPEMRQLSLSFSPVDLSAASFMRTANGQLSDTYIYSYRYDLTQTASADVRGVKITGFDSATPLQPYGGWTARQTASSAAPEPAAWALMLVGFGAIGGAMRRRQRTHVAFG
jgi:hypothetical protein